MRRSRGMTLVELLITAAVFSLLLTLFFWFLVPSLRLSGQHSARVDLQQQATVAMKRIVADLQHSSIDGVSVLPADPGAPDDPVVLAVNRLETVTDEGRQVWEDHLVVYYWDRNENRLYQKRWPPEPPTLAVPLAPPRATRATPQDLKQIATTPNGTERSLALDVEAFEFPPAQSQPFTVRLVLAKETGQSTEPERFDLLRSVTLRN